jgi:hypothetical protein
MGRTGKTILLAGAASLIAAEAWAADGVLLVQKITSSSGTAVSHQIQVEQHRMRIESGGGPAGSQVFVFDGTRQVMLMINDANKTYSEITKDDVDAISSQMSAAMSQAQQATKNMTPEQRAQMDAIMRGGMRGAAAAAPAKTVYKKVGTGTVGKWTCDQYEGYRGDKKTVDLCTVDPKVLGFTAADFAVTKDLSAFYQKLMPSLAQEMFHIGTPEEQGFSGLPVRSVMTFNGQTMTSEITDVHRQSFPDSLFQAPAGYAKTDSPFGAMGRGRK